MALDAEGLKLRFGITEARCGAEREAALEPGDLVPVRRDVEEATPGPARPVDNWRPPPLGSGCMTRFFAWLFTAASLAAVAGFVVVSLGLVTVPPSYNPWRPLDAREAPNILTRFKLARLERNPDECAGVLKRTAVAQTPVPDQTTGDGCGFEDAVRVARSGVSFGSDFVATCPLAVAWALFETHALQPAARRHLSQEVVRVVHLGSYACRNVNHRESGRRSEHATANALDVAGFVLADGARVMLAGDWTGSPARAAFLRDVRDGACRFFDVVLGPDYNAAHRDHFHFDMGRYRACR